MSSTMLNKPSGTDTRHYRGRGLQLGRPSGPLYLALLVLLVWLPLPLGSNRPWAVSIMELYLFALAGLWLALYAAGAIKHAGRLHKARFVIALWLLWIGWVALQLVPLPMEVLEALSPQAAEFYGMAGDYTGLETGGYTLSIAPEATRAHLLETLAYFALFCLVLVTVDTRARLHLLAWTILISALLQALYATLVVMSGVEQDPFNTAINLRRGWATGTFVNRNHLAGYLEIASAVAMGLILGHLTGGSSSKTWRERLRRVTDLLFSQKMQVRVFLAIMVVGLVMTRSRGGNIAFFTSLGVCGLLYMFLRERQLFGKTLLLFVSLFVIDLWIVSSWFGLEQVAARFEEADVEFQTRANVYKDLPPMIEDFLLTGSGLGTFFTAYPYYRSIGVYEFYEHVHNDYAQFLIETGVIGLSLIGLIVLWIAQHAIRVIWCRRDRFVCGMAFAAVMAMTAIAIHSMVDFNLQIPANAATLVVVMAMAASLSTRSRRRRQHKRRGSEKESVTAADEESAQLASGRQQEAPAPILQDRTRLDDLDQPGADV